MGLKKNDIMKNMKKGVIMKKDDIKEKLYVGMDIHEETITGTAMTENGEIQFRKTIPNTKEAVQCFLSGVPSPQVRIAIEACDLWRGVYKMLRGLGYHVILANPLKTRQIAGAKKTDKVDSKTLANLLRTRYLPEVYIPKDDILLLRDLTRHRAQLVRTRQRLQLMMQSSLRKEGIPIPDTWNKETKEFFRKASPYTARFMEILDVIEVQVKRAEREIKTIAHNSYLANILQTIPGIAEFAALMILGEIGDIKRFPHPKKLVNYAGLCPGIYQSGKKSHPIMNKACNKWLKWIMYVCSGRAAMMDTKYKDHYWKIYRKKGEKVAKRSTARKMLQDVYYMLKYEKSFSSITNQ